MPILKLKGVEVAERPCDSRRHKMRYVGFVPDMLVAEDLVAANLVPSNLVARNFIAIDNITLNNTIFNEGMAMSFINIAPGIITATSIHLITNSARRYY